jgi:hypothetical protein
VAILALMVGLIAVSSSIIYAHPGWSDWTLGKDLPWSPDTWNHYIYYDYPSSSFVSAATDLRWYQASGQEVKNSGHRYTHDVADLEEGYPHHLSATGWYNTNFWDPKYDRDGYYIYPEAEVTAQSPYFPPEWIDPWPPQAMYVYMGWQRYSSGDGYLTFTAQLSDWHWWNGEWDAMHYDLLSRKSYSGHNIGTFTAPTGLALKGAVQRECLGIFTDMASTYTYKIVVSPHFEIDVDVATRLISAEDLRSYRAKVHEIATQLKANGIRQALMVLTFKKPVSPTEFRDFVKKYNLSVKAFEARAVNNQGEKVTIGGVPAGEEVFPQDTFAFVAAWSNNDTKLVGITSFEGIVNLDEYERLSNNPLCFLADVLPTQILAEVKQLIAERGMETDMPVDVNLNDVFWVMEALQTQGNH